MTDPVIADAETLTAEWMPYIAELAKRIEGQIALAAAGDLRPNDNEHARVAMDVLAMLYLIDKRDNSLESILTITNAINALKGCLITRIDCRDRGVAYPGFWHLPGTKQ